MAVMGNVTKIQWADHTLNLWRGCTEVSEGCDNCYARVMAKRNPDTLGSWGPEGNGGTRVAMEFTTVARYCRNWRDQGVISAAMGHANPRVFVNSLSDFFEDWRGVVHLTRVGRSEPLQGINEHNQAFTTLDYVRTNNFHTMMMCRDFVSFLLLTKRPQLIRRALWQMNLYANVSGRPAHDTFTLDGFWVGVTAENQARLDERAPFLLDLFDPKVRFLSCEPLLGPLDLSRYLVGKPRIDWVIVGGESIQAGKARTCHLEWIDSIIGQCRLAGCPVFVKQLGGIVFGDTQQLRLKDRHGGDPETWPANLAVREVPNG